MEPVEDLRQRAELEPVQLDVLPRRELAVAAAELVRDLADRAQPLGRDSPARQLDPEHERPDLRLVVVEAPPLQPDDVLLVDALVAGRDQGGQLVEDPERAPVALDPLDRVPLVDELPVRRRLQGCHLRDTTKSKATFVGIASAQAAAAWRRSSTASTSASISIGSVRERDRPRRLQPVAGDEQHDAIVRADLAGARPPRAARPASPRRAVSPNTPEVPASSAMHSPTASSATAWTAPFVARAVATARSPSAGLPIASERATVSGRTGRTGSPVCERGRDRGAALRLAADQPRNCARRRARAHAAP